MGIRHVYINGTNLTGDEVFMEQNTWNVVENLGSKSIFNCVLKDVNGITINLGDEIRLYDGTTYIWGGSIKECPDKELEIGVLTYYVRAEDFNELLERPLIIKGFVETSIEDMVKYIIAEFLTSYGITEGVISATTVINRTPFNYVFAHSALNQLQSYGNYVWNVNKDKQLSFQTIGYAINPTPITDNSLKTNIFNFARTRTLDNYRNRQYTKGTDRLSVLQTNITPTPTPNSSNREFFIKYKLALEPVIEVNRGTGWIAQEVGIRGLHDNQPNQWWWSYGSSQISHDEDEAVLTATDQIRVTYYGLIPLIVIAQKSSEVTLRGYYDAYSYNGNISDIIDGFRYSYNLLDKYANEADTISFRMYSKIYDVGEQVHISNTIRNIAEYFLVKSCTWTARGINEINYDYHVLDGTDLGGWEDFFKNLIEASKININDEEIVIYTKQDTDDIILDGLFDMTLITPLYPSLTLYPSLVLTPGTIDSTDSVSD